MITRLHLLDKLLPYCDGKNAALLYPKDGAKMSPGWIQGRAEVARAIEAYRNGTLGEESFASVTQTGQSYTIHRPQRLGLVLHRHKKVGVICVDLDDHTGDGGTVRYFEAVNRFLGAQPVAFTSKSGTGLHFFFVLQTPLPIVEFVKWAKGWGFNRSGQIEIFPKTEKLSQVFLPNEPNETGGDAYVSGDFETCIIDELPPPPTVRLTNATFDFLRGFTLPGSRNDALNKASHELARCRMPRDEAWQLCQRGAELCGLYAEEKEQTGRTFDSGFSAGTVERNGQPTEDLPVVLLPGRRIRINDAGRELGQLLAVTEKFYLRGRTLVTLDRQPGQRVQLKTVKPAALASQFENVATLKKLRPTPDGEIQEPAICSEQIAKMITNAESFANEIPPIHVISPCPVLTDRDGELVVVSGYDRESGILAEGPPVEDVSLDKARDLILELLCDFNFATPADKSRAVAAMITPALVFGGLLSGRAPVDLGEADQSQAGKGYRNKLTAAIYRQSIATVTQKKGGVGSMEETFNAALIKGRNFISLDNVRGMIDSPAIESFLTEDCYLARIPYEQSVEIDARRVVVQLTSNKAELTPDLANRCSSVRILKNPDGYKYKQFAEGDVLDHVRAKQALYLGAVFAFVREWIARGRPETRENRHDFRRWARRLDWIVQNLLGLAPLMEGYLETKTRMTTPSLSWLRDVTNVVRRKNRLEESLRTHQIVEIIADEPNVEVPGLTETDDIEDGETRRKAFQAVGRRFAKCFGDNERVVVDDITILRENQWDPDSRNYVKTYRFCHASMVESAHRRTIDATIDADHSQDSHNGTDPSDRVYKPVYDASKAGHHIDASHNKLPINDLQDAPEQHASNASKRHGSSKLGKSAASNVGLPRRSKKSRDPIDVIDAASDRSTGNQRPDRSKATPLGEADAANEPDNGKASVDRAVFDLGDALDPEEGDSWQEL